MFAYAAFHLSDTLIFFLNDVGEEMSVRVMNKFPQLRKTDVHSQHNYAYPHSL